ncbi:transcriptional regulatory protein C1F7.11c [Penicillium pulvis]|uniref:transcriptional regulatory protein C1F7.11c n=1 Tax=Penicillium pulvis TaxID=1562058 RepID=UPI002546F271|nr:transcriptional regulatory protein C1F7.11c [Penicillium pulvis]KAJ5784553.1 transcriptional regulatory protein C1F7.11c [Penicillium pulvis]
MPKDPRKPLNQSALRACINCQRRKTRCFRPGSETGPCSYCTRKGKTCSFESPPDRTPLTRKNLDLAERRCTQLRSLLHSLNPDLDVKSALEQLGSEQDVADSPTLDGSIELASSNYEWHEGSLSPDGASPDGDKAITTDGMATLSTNDSGYLGQGKEGDANLIEHFTDREFHHLSLQICYFPVLHEKTFRDRVTASQQQTPPSSPWRVTYYMALAIGHWALSNESEHVQSKFYTAARSSLSLQMLESGTVETVQAFLLMGNYLQKRDRTNTGYNFIGLAYRMAIGLGLHREPTGVEDTIGHERRRQLFWTIYCFESGFNITTGRPPTIVDGFIDIRLPRNVDDKVPSEVDYPTTYSAIIAQAQLAKLADSTYHEYLLAKTAGSRIEYRLAESMERDLFRWYKSLPSYFTSMDVPSWFRGPRAVILWKEQNLRILLWRGSQRHHSFLPTKVNADVRCLNVAMDSIHNIATFCTIHESNLHQSLAWYATYFLLQATLVLTAGLLDKNSQIQPESSELHHSVFQSRNCLRMLAIKNKSAARYMEMLDRICSQIQSPVPDLEMNQYSYDLSNGAGFDASRIDVPNHTQSFAELPSENDFMIPGENQFAFNDDTTDPNLRMLINQVSQDFTGSMPLDLLFNDWMNYSA